MYNINTIIFKYNPNKQKSVVNKLKIHKSFYFSKILDDQHTHDS